MRVANQSTVETQRNQMVKSLFCDVVKRWSQCGHDPDRSWGGGGGGGQQCQGVLLALDGPGGPDIQCRVWSGGTCCGQSGRTATNSHKSVSLWFTFILQSSTHNVEDVEGR